MKLPPSQQLDFQRIEGRIIDWQDNIEKVLNRLIKKVDLKVDIDMLEREEREIRVDRNEMPVRSERVEPRLQKFERMDFPEKPPIDNNTRLNKYNSDHELNHPL